MRKLIVLLILILMCGCANNDDMVTQLDKVFASESMPSARANNYTDYIEYYVPGDVNEEDADELSISFSSYDCKFVANINVASIINKEYYSTYKLNDDGFFDESKLVYENSGTINNLNKETLSYIFKAYKYDDKCLMHLISDEINIYGYGAIDKAGLLASKMMQFASSNNVNNDKIVENFSNKDVIDYQKGTVNLFENIFPVSGRVEDMKVKDGEVSE